VFSLIKIIANTWAWFGVAVVVSIQVMSNPDASAGPYMTNEKKLIGGNIVARASTTRLQFKGSLGNTRTAKIHGSLSISTVLEIQTKFFQIPPPIIVTFSSFHASLQ